MAQRGGSPSAFDRLLATRMGISATRALINNQSDLMMALQGRSIETVPLDKVVSKQRVANLDYYEMCKMLAF